VTAKLLSQLYESLNLCSHLVRWIDDVIFVPTSLNVIPQSDDVFIAPVLPKLEALNNNIPTSHLVASLSKLAVEFKVSQFISPSSCAFSKYFCAKCHCVSSFLPSIILISTVIA
jgi:hypothetical protein